MGNNKHIKNCTYYFSNDMIKIIKFDLKLLKIDKNSCDDITIYYIGHVTVKDLDDYVSIYSINPS